MLLQALTLTLTKQRRAKRNLCWIPPERSCFSLFLPNDPFFDDSAKIFSPLFFLTQHNQEKQQQSKQTKPTTTISNRPVSHNYGNWQLINLLLVVVQRTYSIQPSKAAKPSLTLIDQSIAPWWRFKIGKNNEHPDVTNEIQRPEPDRDRFGIREAVGANEGLSK